QSWGTRGSEERTWCRRTQGGGRGVRRNSPAGGDADSKDSHARAPRPNRSVAGGCAEGRARSHTHRRCVARGTRADSQAGGKLETPRGNDEGGGALGSRREGPPSIGGSRGHVGRGVRVVSSRDCW